jgi:hypothetical protein
MKNSNIKSATRLFLAALAMVAIGCDKDENDFNEAGFPKTAEVFIDDFTSDLAYAAFGGSDVKAFQIDKQVTYDGSAAAIRFAVPDADSPEGAFAGGVFLSKTGRDLSGFNALTFYIKASQPASIGVVGFGNDFGQSLYQVSLSGLAVNANWRKVILPIPDASKLEAEKGLFYCSSGPENGHGYTIWIDEVKFEKLTDLANITGVILDGEDIVSNSSETGDIITMSGFGARANLPTGITQTVSISPYYLDFASSNSSVASVSMTGQVRVVDAGSCVINATLGGLAAEGSLSITSTGAPVMPETAAPAPTKDPEDVISMYSNTYDNVTVDTWNTHWLYSTAENQFLQVDGNDIIRYRELNFVGVEFSTQTINASSMRFFHMDIWTPDATEMPNNFKIQLVDFGADGAYGGGDDSSHEVAITSPTLKTEEWVSLDIPLSSFTGLTNRGHLAQLVLSGTLPNVYVDNVYFYRNPVAPTTAAPSPTKDQADVISIFSNAYNNIEGTDFNPNWGQATVVTQTPIEGNNTLVYSNLNYQGIQLGSTQNVSGMRYLHLDYYSSTSSTLNVYLISTGPVETPYTLTVPTGSGWSSVDIPLSAFAPVNLSEVIQMKFDGDGDIYLDNIFFYREPVAPTTAAPEPTKDASDVISIFSDAYTNVAGTDFNPNWGQATIVTQTPIQGNNTLVYSNLNYQGTQFGSSQNVAAMSHLHLDYYSTNATELQVFLISSGPVEAPYTLTVPTQSGWSSANIPLSAFAPVNLSDVIQIKIVGNGDVYLDNIFFYRNPITPTTAAPTPTQDASNVISIFSDAYTNVAGTDFNPNWGQATVVTQTPIQGNNTLVYSNLNYQGTQFGSSQNVAAMSHLHVDYYSTNANQLQVFLISPGPVEMPYSLSVPTQSGWNSVNIPLTAFSPVNLSDVFQIKIVGNGDVYLDNIFFYASGSGGSNGCSGTLVPAASLPLDFEGCETFPSDLSFGTITSGIAPNPAPGGINSSNYALKVEKMAGAEFWSGIQNNFASNFDLNATPNFKMKIYSSKPNVTFRFEVAQDDNNIGNPAPQFVTVASANTWTEVQFSFSNIPAPTAYFRLVIKPDNDQADSPITSSGVYYFDDISINP